MNGASGAGVSRRRFLGQAAGAAVVAGAVGSPAFLRSAAAQSRTVHIGASLPLTGTYEKVSRICRDGYEFFLKANNGKMIVAGEPRDIRLTIYDDENNASRAAQLTERLISSDKVDLVLGTYGTDTVLAQGAILQKNGWVFLQSGAASRRVDEEIGGRTAFTCIGPPSTYGVGVVNFLARQQPKPATLAVVTMDDPVYHEIGQGVKDKAAQYGIKLVQEIVLPMNVQDLRPAALKLKSAGNVDIVYNTGWDLICVKLVQEMAALGVMPKAFVGGHLTMSPIVRETLGPKMDGIVGSTFWAPQLKYSDQTFPSGEAFSEKFKATFGYAATYHAVYTYILPWIYQEVLKDADPKDPFNQSELRRKLAAFKRDNSMWGPISFNEKGRIKVEAAPAIQWLGKPAEPLVVEPRDMAQSAGVYPMPAW